MNITNAAELAEHRKAYADLASTFDPINFNATDMAQRAKRAGFKYLVYTTVHCDGAGYLMSDLNSFGPFSRIWKIYMVRLARLYTIDSACHVRKVC